MSLKCPNLPKNILICWLADIEDIETMLNKKCSTIMSSSLTENCFVLVRMRENTCYLIEKKLTLQCLTSHITFQCKFKLKMSKAIRSPTKINTKQQFCVNKVYVLIQTYESVLLTHLFNHSHNNRK